MWISIVKMTFKLFCATLLLIISTPFISLGFLYQYMIHFVRYGRELAEESMDDFMDWLQG